MARTTDFNKPYPLMSLAVRHLEKHMKEFTEVEELYWHLHSNSISICYELREYASLFVNLFQNNEEYPNTWYEQTLFGLLGTVILYHKDWEDCSLKVLPYFRYSLYLARLLPRLPFRQGGSNFQVLGHYRGIESYVCYTALYSAIVYATKRFSATLAKAVWQTLALAPLLLESV